MQIRNKFTGWLTLAVFATVGGAMVAADPAFAKVDVDKLTVSGEARIRYEYRVGATFGGTQANESAASHRIRVGIGYDLTPDVGFFAQFQDARVYGSEGCAFAPAATAGNGCATTGIGAVSSANNSGTGVDLHQGYILVKNAGAQGLSLKLGRQEIIFGDHRLFGHFGWSQIGNSFDGARGTWASKMADVDLFWARISDNDGAAAGSTAGVIFPAAGQQGTDDQDIFGAYVTLKPVANWTIEPYWFLLTDGRTSAGAAAATYTTQAPNQHRHTLGGRINGKAGGLDATAEGAWQFGSVSSGVAGGLAGNQYRDLHINAHAEAVKVGYTMAAVPMKPRIGVEFNYASGDGDNASSAAGAGNRGNMNTFDNLFPTNHFHYGYMDLMAWKNMVNYQVMFDVKPSDVSKFQINFIWHRLANTRDNWYRAGQVAYATSAASNQAASIGQELDIHYWHTFKEKFKFEVGYGHFFTGEYLEKLATKNTTGAPTSTATFTSNGDQNWGYVMTSVLF